MPNESNKQEEAITWINVLTAGSMDKLTFHHEWVLTEAETEGTSHHFRPLLFYRTLKHTFH